MAPLCKQGGDGTPPEIRWCFVLDPFHAARLWVLGVCGLFLSVCLLDLDLDLETHLDLGGGAAGVVAATERVTARLLSSKCMVMVTTIPKYLI